MFAEIDKEDDGIIYVRDVIFYLKAMNDDMENKKVKYNPKQGFSLHLLFLQSVTLYSDQPTTHRANPTHQVQPSKPNPANLTQQQT